MRLGMIINGSLAIGLAIIVMSITTLNILLVIDMLNPADMPPAKECNQQTEVSE